MSADIVSGAEAEALTLIADTTSDPVAEFNALNEHTGSLPSYELDPPRVLRPEGDPVAVAEIKAAIEAAGGQITFAEYMRLALYGEGGYYSQGKARLQSPMYNVGEFHTSPEQSPDFSNAVTMGNLAILAAMGWPRYNQFEPGAGSGRMAKETMAALRFLNRFAYDKAHVFIADYGGMRARQEMVIGSDLLAHPGSYAAMSTPEDHALDLSKVEWIPGSAVNAKLDNGKPTLINANEVHDASPADKVRNNSGTLEQAYVALNEDGQLIEIWRELTDEIRAYIDKYHVTVESGYEVAISTAALDLHRNLCRIVKRGALTCFDYGEHELVQYPHAPWTPPPRGTNPLTGAGSGRLRRGRAVHTYPEKLHPLQMPGEVDLTFEPHHRAILDVSIEEGMTPAFVGSQSELLHTLGLPDGNTFMILPDVPGLSQASKERIYRAAQLMNGFRGLVLTRDVYVDLSRPRATMPAYRGLAYRAWSDKLTRQPR